MGSVVRANPTVYQGCYMDGAITLEDNTVEPGEFRRLNPKEFMVYT